MTEVVQGSVVSTSVGSNAASSGDDATVKFKLQYGRSATEIERPANSTIGELKGEIDSMFGIPPPMQKLMFHGLLKDDSQTLREANIKDGAKVMLVGSSPKDLLSVANPQPSNEAKELKWDSQVKEEPLCQQAKHKKVLDKGIPEGALPGIKGRQVQLPENQLCIPGLLNALGNKVRLTFKPELQQLWIGSAQATQKVSYGMISKIESFSIEGQEEYCILSLQIGPSSSTRYWLYYVPSQYVAAIKLRILGVMSLL